MRLMKQLWVWWLRRVREEVDDAQDDIKHTAKSVRWGLIAIVAYMVSAIAIGFYWSFLPPQLDAKQVLQKALIEQSVLPPSAPQGAATTASLIVITETLWQKPGGYLLNDKLPPGLLLDDMPSWELGVLLEARTMTATLADSLSQSTENRMIDDDLQKARVRLNFSSNSWFFPATESQYKAGIIHLKKYFSRLVKSPNHDAYFFSDADHLNDYLAGVEQRLKNLSQRLTASVGPSVNTDSSALVTGQVGTGGLYIKTPWLKIDNVFYEARGSSWALIGLLNAIKIDFTSTLQEKNAQACYEQIIRELSPTQQTLYSPLILNGDGFGFVANHSLLMASYLSRAQAAVADCRRQLLKP